MNGCNEAQAAERRHKRHLWNAKSIEGQFMSHAYCRLHYHLIFSTKNRLRTITPEIKPKLYAYAVGIVQNLGGVLTAIGGIEDHVHLLFYAPPKHALSE